MPSFTDYEKWGPEFVRKLPTARFDRPPQQKVIVFSDYSAGAPHGQYDAYSYGFVTPKSVIVWNQRRSRWRQKMLPSGRLMEWKNSQGCPSLESIAKLPCGRINPRWMVHYRSC